MRRYMPSAITKPESQLTDMQRLFVEQLVENTLNPTAAARAAGYGDPRGSAYYLMRQPHIAAAIREQRARLIGGDLANIALGTLRGVMVDSDAPAAARVSAARTVLEMSGELRKDAANDDGGKKLHEMTLDELSAVIDKWESQRAAAAKDITPAIELVERVDKTQ